jgi:hypothetical protein
MGKLATSWDLVKTSFSILRSDKELVLLPLTSAFLSFLTLATLFGGYFAMYWPEVRAAHAAGTQWQFSHSSSLYALIFVFYVVNYFIVIFCNVALAGVANSRMCGGTWTMRDGLALAWARKFTIFKWAVFAATVGMILRWISERVGILGKIVVGLVGLAWAFAVYFIVPVLAFEDLDPVDALKRSAQLFRKTWGENVVAGISFSFIFTIALFAGIAVLFAAFSILPATLASMIIAVILFCVYVLMIFVVSSATTSIFNVALYRYAMTGKPQGGFSEEQFKSAWVPKN